YGTFLVPIRPLPAGFEPHLPTETVMPGSPSLPRAIALALALLTVLVSASANHACSAAEPRLELKKGDHVCLIGNTLADRMQHDGWLETYLQTRFPNLELTIRNLGFSADELATRPRNQNFGEPDKHLTHSK